MTKTEIHTNSKTISLNGGQPFSIFVPNTDDAEYKQAMQDEYYFRTYYQALDTWRKGGYVQFDTLTYANNHLPHISDFCVNFKGHITDFPCFSVEHYRKFFVLLRKRLERQGFDVKHNLKYFLTSEYGTDPSKTHRPHYHVLFFITDRKITPQILSQAIADAWPYGRTDNYYNGYQYTMKHTYMPSESNDPYAHNVLKYVSDYVTKSSEFEAAIENRIQIALSKLHFSDKAEAKKWRREFKRHMCQFHRQSQGYGAYGLVYNDAHTLFNDGMMEMPDRRSVVKHIPLPLYFQRKLFYDLTKDYRGNKKWMLNEKGVEFKLNHLDANIDRVAKKFEDWRANLPENATVHEVYDVEGRHHIYTQDDLNEMNKQYCEWVDSYLDGRSWRDFAEYILVYKGRIKTRQMINNEEKGIYNVPSPIEFYKKSLAKPSTSSLTFFNFTTEADVEKYGTKFICLREPREDETYTDLVLDGAVITHNLFNEAFVINDKCDPRFRGFDRLYSIYVESQYYTTVRKNKVFNKKEQLRQTYAKFS